MGDRHFRFALKVELLHRKLRFCEFHVVGLNSSVMRVEFVARRLNRELPINFADSVFISDWLNTFLQIRRKYSSPHVVQSNRHDLHMG